MEIEIKEITKYEYKVSHCQILFDNEKSNRCFGVISNTMFCFKFAWNSDMIKPVYYNKNNICFIGIDLNFAIINFNSGIVELNYMLNYLFCDILILDDFIFIISELEIIKVNLIHYKVIATYDIPDIVERIIEIKDNDEIKIECLGGEVFTVSASP